MDETGVHLLPVSKRTLAARGSRVVPITHSDDKRQITCIVGGDLTGKLLPPQVIYGPGAKNRLPSVPGVHTTWSDNHWASFTTTTQWLMEVLLPAAMSAKQASGLPDDHPCLLTWDVYSSHRSTEVRQFIADHIPWLRLVYVPANCTDFLQVADVSLNTPFKRRLRQLCEQWLIQGMVRDGKVDTTLRSLRIQAARWTKLALDSVAETDAAVNGIRKVGLAQAFRQDWISKAMSLHSAQHLWASASRNDIVAAAGMPGTAAVAIPPPPAVLDMSDDEAAAAAAAPRPRVRIYHCSFCKKRGHTKARCSIFKVWVAERRAKLSK